MIGVMYWNTHNNKDIDTYLVSAIIENRCHIVVLSEYPNDLNNLCNLLSKEKRDFAPAIVIDGANRIRLIHDKRIKISVIRDQNRHFSLYMMEISKKRVLIAGVHFISKCRIWSEDEQKDETRRLVKGLVEVRTEETIDNVIIIGDFNFNPFDRACYQADCLHALPFLNKVKKDKKRKVREVEYEMYYNPMWNLMEFTKSPVCTYFYNNSQLTNFFWNIYDQVIFSSSMVECFLRDTLKIIRNINEESLIDSNGKPNVKKVSDHLPICFSIEEERLQ